MPISDAELEFNVHCLQQGVRLDGRGCNDFRPVEIQLGPIEQASGSARVHLGGTDVLVGVKVEVSTPSIDQPNQGRLQSSVECSSCASPEYEGRGGQSWSLQLARTLQSTLVPGPGRGLDLAKLCIVAGKSAWLLCVDALVLNDDGNVLDALCLAARAALANTLIPHVRVVAGEGGEAPELELDDDAGSSTPLDVSGVPLLVSVSQVGPRSVVDCNFQEEMCTSCSCHVGINAEGLVCGMTKSGESAMDPATLMAMVELAQQMGAVLIQRQDAFLAASLKAQSVLQS